MARIAELNYRKTPKGWLVNIPGSLSDTGRFRRRYFSTRDKAKAETQRLNEIQKGQRGLATDISTGSAEDAIKAQELLVGYNVTLAQAAVFYVTHHDKRSKAPTMRKAWRDAIAHRKNHRPATLASYKKMEKKLPDWFMDMNCHDIGPDHIKKALDEYTPGATAWKNGRAYISSVMGDLVKLELIAENPTKKMMVMRPEETDDEVTIYTPEELKCLFAACIDYPAEKGQIDRLCDGCKAPFAFMAFAGIRPEEITKLKWEHVSPELRNIRIGSTVAKKAYRRNVRINDTMAAWINTVHEDERKGRIIPARWRYKAAKVRIKAGIDGREKQDALRHSFGTYTLAVDNDLDQLKRDMGHAHMAVFFDHYHKAVTKADALPYWQVMPAGVEAPATIQPVESVA
jgi:integrase